MKQPFTHNILQKIEAAPWPYLPVDRLPIFGALDVKSEGIAPQVLVDRLGAKPVRCALAG